MQKSIILRSELRNELAKLDQSEANLLRLFFEVDKIQAYFDFECGSLREFAWEELGMDPSRSNPYIRVSRASREMPELIGAVVGGRVKLTNALTISPLMTNSNVSRSERLRWIERAAILTKLALQNEIAKKRPDVVAADYELLVQKSENLSVFTIMVTNEERELFERLRALKRTRKIKEALFKVVAATVEELDPVNKARRAASKENRKTSRNKRVSNNDGIPDSNVQSSDSRITRRALSHERVNEVHLRDGGQCAWVHPATKQRCDSRHFLEIHHILPLSEGGSDDLSNLITYCHGHHKLQHYR